MSDSKVIRLSEENVLKLNKLKDLYYDLLPFPEEFEFSDNNIIAFALNCAISHFEDVGYYDTRH